MIFKRKKVASALAYLLGAGGAAALIASGAEAADIRVEVTGSNIKRIEGEGALRPDRNVPMVTESRKTGRGRSARPR